MSVNCGNTVYRAVVIGASAGGLLAMEEILKNLKPSFVPDAPVIPTTIFKISTFSI